MKKNLLALQLCVCLSVFVLTTNAQNRTQKQSFGGSYRANAAGFSIGTKGYLGTGTNGTSDQSTFYEYDPSTNVWTQKANYGGNARSGAVAFSIGTKGYLGLGRSGSTEFSDFWEFDPLTNSWAPISSFAGTPRSFATGFSIGSKGYVGTGINGSTYYNDFWEYNPSTDTWTVRTSFGGNAREGATGISIGSKGYIGTGKNASTFFTDFWEYDPSTDTWTPKTSIGGSTRAYSFGFALGAKGYIGGGRNNSVHLADMWEYDVATDTWNWLGAAAGSNSFIGAVAFNIGSKGYFGTGRNEFNNLLDNWWEYDPIRITTGSLGASSYCSGATISVSYTSSDITFSSGNVFTVQLSSPGGSFANPVNIGSSTSTAVSGTITATIPANTLDGAYRVRVVSSNEATAGSNNGSNFTVIGDDGWSGFIGTSRDQSIDLKSGPWLNYICENSWVFFQISQATGVSPYQLVSGNIPNTWYFDGNYLYFEMLPATNSNALFSVDVILSGCSKTIYFSFQSMECNYRKAESSTDTIIVKSVGKKDMSRPVLRLPFVIPHNKNVALDHYFVPNPVKDELNIFLDKKLNSLDKQIQRLQIFDLTGKSILQQSYPSNTTRISLNVNTLAPGMYIVKIYDGKEWTTSRFIKE